MTDKMTMVNTYERFSKAEKYIIGFAYDKQIYMVMVDEINPEYLTVEAASRNQGDNLRLRIRKAHKAQLLDGSICLGSVEQLTAEKYNKGENFEKLVTEYYGQVWAKDTVPFWVAGDITINHIEIQIKFDAATLMNTKQMAKLLAIA